MNNLITINHKEQRVLTTQQLADAYETDPSTITKNFNRNKERYDEGKHYFVVEGEELQELKTKGQFVPSSRVNKLNVWTEKGALLHAKSLGTDKAWEVCEMLIETYFRVKEQAMIPKTPAEMLALMAQQAVDQERKLNEIGGTVQSIKETIIMTMDNWRTDIKRMVNAIVEARGNNDHAGFRGETYIALERRASVNLCTRYANRQKDMEKQGYTKTQIKALSKLDVIESDKKLKEIYMSVVKEYYIKYCS